MGRCEQNTFCITFRSFLFNLGVLSTSWSVTPSLCHIPRPRAPVMIDVSLRPATPLLHVHPQDTNKAQEESSMVFQGLSVTYRDSFPY